MFLPHFPIFQFKQSKNVLFIIITNKNQVCYVC